MIFGLTRGWKMDISRLNNYFYSFVMVIAVIGIIQPVLAQEGSMTISYL
jgi:hypothetical protein